MELMVSKTPTSPEFHFSSSTVPSPYASAPSSPKPFGNVDEYYYSYTSAPASPARAAAAYSVFAEGADAWEEARPTAPRHEFDFSLGQKEIRRGKKEELSTAEELFDKGRIRPLKSPRPLPRLDLPPKSPRGRERAPSSPPVAPSRRKKESSSLSPSRRGERVPVTPPPSTSSAKSSGSRKWRLKDLFLFRSASEGRATGRGSRDPLRKYTLLSSSSSSSLLPSFNKRRPGGDNNGGMKGGGPPVSPHELHYTANRAASEEQKKKPPLPFNRNGLFGCRHFNPVVRSIARGFNASSFNISRS